MLHDFHHIPGRVRVRVPALKRNRDLSRAAGRRLRAIPGVRFVRCRPLTGSIVIVFDEWRVEPETIVDVLVDEGYLPEGHGDAYLAPNPFAGFERAVEVLTAWALRKCLERAVRAAAPWA